MTPSQAIAALRDLPLSDAAIGAQVGASQSTIHRIRNGAEPRHGLGERLVKLARERAGKGGQGKETAHSE